MEGGGGGVSFNATTGRAGLFFSDFVYGVGGGCMCGGRGINREDGVSSGWWRSGTV